MLATVMTGLPLLFLSASAGTAPGEADSAPPLLPYRTSWVGNTYGGKAGKWVPQDFDALFVTPDGTCYTNTHWDENGREIGIFKDGRVLGKGPYQQFTHGWGYNGGNAIAANEKYVFLEQSVGNEGGGLVNPTTWPEKGKTWFGISRRLRSDVSRGAPFPGGKGGGAAQGRGAGSATSTLKSSLLVVNEVPEGTAASLRGMAATKERLYVSNPYRNEILVYDAERMVRKGAWKVNRPGRIALEGTDRLWVIQAGEGNAPHRAVSLGTDGGKRLQEIVFPRAVEPTALWADRKGRLWVADNGPDQNLKIYSHLRTKPRLDRTFGAKGGVFAGEGMRIGRTGPRRRRRGNGRPPRVLQPGRNAEMAAPGTGVCRHGRSRSRNEREQCLHGT
ncbi:MAG: hypothetical protein KY468_19190 [Armatimonadetes bacterium]|nr:hypothetical protein [Armatimonadota bacterium]